jgi:hypothetical protein
MRRWGIDRSRDPGKILAPAPDFAALHPGYEDNGDLANDEDVYLPPWV